MSDDKHGSAREQVLFYHEQTKHHFHKAARSLGYMDWANQPDPFRFYTGCPLIRLPLMANDPVAEHEALFLHGILPPRPLKLENIAGMIELSMGLSAWKVTPGSTWSLRMNPSSGNLHPTESYWILPAGEGCAGGVYHYSPFLHALEMRAGLPDTVNKVWYDHFGTSGFMVALSSIFWREAWKYGERAFRYCHHDVGHALAALRFAANLMGWRVHLLHGISDRNLGRMLGFNRTDWVAGEEDEADLLCWVCPAIEQPNLSVLPCEFIEIFDRITYQGRPESLSRERHPWPIIDTVAAACRKNRSEVDEGVGTEFSPAIVPGSTWSSAQLIRRRRSAVAFDRGRSRMSRKHFYGCLQACLPRPNQAPFDVGLGESQVHLFVFVHQVDDLQPGLYVLVRNPQHFNALRENTHPHFLWSSVEKDLPLYLLEPGDWQVDAKLVSCNQEIAGDGAFSLGMVACFRDSLEVAPHRYKHLFWEAGMVGQVLYLQAEAYGLRGTGIGCFFDDPMHDICGFRDNRYQDVYHFTVGYPIEDGRLSMKPPYYHLQNVQAVE